MVRKRDDFDKEKIFILTTLAFVPSSPSGNTNNAIAIKAKMGFNVNYGEA